MELKDHTCRMGEEVLSQFHTPPPPLLANPKQDTKTAPLKTQKKRERGKKGKGKGKKRKTKESNFNCTIETQCNSCCLKHTLF